MDTDFVKSQLQGHRGEDRVVAVHRAWPDDNGSLFRVVNTAEGSPTSNYLQIAAGGVAKESSRDNVAEYYLFAIFDGHGGEAAASYAMGSLVPVLEAYLPACELLENVDGAAAWAGALQEALVKTVLELNRRFAVQGEPSGCTATMVLQIGQLLTCCSLGHTHATLDAGTGPLVTLTADHSVARNSSERERLLSMGGRLAPLDVSGSGPAMAPARAAGSVRYWPGGLTLSRTIGDFALGPALVALPHVRQLLLSPGGARVVLASDAVWRHADGELRALMRSAPLKTAAYQVTQLLSQRGVATDASVIVADTCPRGCCWQEVVAAAAEQARLLQEARLAAAAAEKKGSRGRLMALLGRRRGKGADDELVGIHEAQSSGSGTQSSGAASSVSLRGSTAGLPVSSGGGHTSAAFPALAVNSPTLLTDVDTAALLGMVRGTSAPGGADVDENSPIWFEESVAVELDQALADAWRISTLIRSRAGGGSPASARGAGLKVSRSALQLPDMRGSRTSSNSSMAHEVAGGPGGGVPSWDLSRSPAPAASLPREPRPPRRDNSPARGAVRRDSSPAASRAARRDDSPSGSRRAVRRDSSPAASHRGFRRDDSPGGSHRAVRRDPSPGGRPAPGAPADAPLPPHPRGPALAPLAPSSARRIQAERAAGSPAPPLAPAGPPGPSLLLPSRMSARSAGSSAGSAGSSLLGEVSGVEPPPAAPARGEMPSLARSSDGTDGGEDGTSLTCSDEAAAGSPGPAGASPKRRVSFADDPLGLGVAPSAAGSLRGDAPGRRELEGYHSRLASSALGFGLQQAPRAESALDLGAAAGRRPAAPLPARGAGLRRTLSSEDVNFGSYGPGGECDPLGASDRASSFVGLFGPGGSAVRLARGGFGDAALLGASPDSRWKGAYQSSASIFTKSGAGRSRKASKDRVGFW